ncbi:site-specific integrase [Pedobacter sp. Leaf132]|uniref:tyrosine-type recombinase/integrase n=1 Tax=Pedobacter sp. Leaf132 TaxID=2876557 RepID=UPI001E2CC07F|nr:site-specific integrase [Pedobacter sp. Leaf132]
MFTEPKIVSNDKLKSRAYVIFYYNGKRYREYNGKRLNLDLNPNYSKTLKDKNRLLSALRFAFQKALDSGWSPLKDMSKLRATFGEGLIEVLNDKLSSEYSRTYKRDLETLHKQLTEFLPKHLMGSIVADIDRSYFEKFLNQFKSSNRHYMNKRRSLSVFFTGMIKKGYTTLNPALDTDRLKVKSVLHEPYSSSELKAILGYLKVHYPNLHLCCLMTYGCLLRPHQEIRLLRKSHFNDDLTRISLSGKENKSGRIRSTFVPQYVKDELEIKLSDADGDDNIFTLDKLPFNDDYFKTQWSRAKTEMLKIRLIRKGQTIYSFRHSGAIAVYKKTKDIHILQQVLQHSDMAVTLNYLRGLGEVADERLRDVLPEL